MVLNSAYKLRIDVLKIKELATRRAGLRYILRYLRARVFVKVHGILLICNMPAARLADQRNAAFA